MKNKNQIEARLKDIITTIADTEIDSYEFNCLIEKKELLELVLKPNLDLPKQNPTISINEVCDLCNGLVDKEDKFTEEKHCVNCGWF